MSLLKPFSALRPDPRVAAQVAAVPYDVVNREEAAALAQGNPLSFLRISRAEIELPEEKNAYAPAIYTRARHNLDRLIHEAPLVREARPALYVYRLERGSQTQTGVAGTFSIDEYDTDRILKHERTRKEKEDDRTRHLLALGAQTGPVFLAYRDTPSLAQTLAEITRGEPLYRFEAADGVRHTVWMASAAHESALIQGFSGLTRLYIADGHHRAASASRARAELKKAPGHLETGPDNFVLAVAFAASELKILPYYRVVADLHGLSHAGYLERVAKTFELQEIPAGSSVDPKPGEFSMLMLESDRLVWRRMIPREAKSTDPIEALDVSVLQDRLLAPTLGIADPRTDHRIDFVGGIRGTKELERLVRSQQAAVAFALSPTRIEELFAVSDAGGIMPPKSTWFEPKLRDGLLSHVITTI